VSTSFNNNVERKRVAAPSQPDALDQLAAGRAVISRKEVALALNRSPETIDEWIERKLFPAWLQQTPGGPKEQTVETVRAWIEKRRRSRYVAPKARGALMRGSMLRRRRTGGK
jgi:hypothetical protein